MGGHRRQRQRLLVLAAALTALMFITTGPGPASALGTVVPLAETPTADEEGADPSGEVTAELPPPDIPASNPQGYTFELKASLKADLKAVVREAPVYELIPRTFTIEDAQKIADRLRIGGQVQERGNGIFEATGTGQVFISPDVIQYFSLEDIRKGRLPTDDEAVAFAREWLRLTGLLPPDLGEARIVGRVEESQRVVVQFQPEEPKGILSAYPSILVALGPTGTILEASIRWAEIRRADLYQLRPAREAWHDVESGQAFIEVELPEEAAPAGAEVQGSVTYSAVEVAYTTAGPPGGRQYLQPIYVFRGRLKIEGFDKSFPLRAYVPALANVGAPVGQFSGGATL